MLSNLQTMFLRIQWTSNQQLNITHENSRGESRWQPPAAACTAELAITVERDPFMKTKVARI